MIIDKIITITSAVIRDESGRILLLQRREDSTFGGQWQLPEGKIEESEKPDAALAREIHEELQQHVAHKELCAVTRSEFEAKGVRYLCIRLIYAVKLESLQIFLSDEHIAFEWIDIDRLYHKQLIPGTSDAINAVI